MMDDNYFLHHILNVYTDSNYEYANLYRFVGIGELTNLFEKRVWRFTNPKAWTSTDQFETYFEEWWNSEEKLKLWLTTFTENLEKTYNEIGISTCDIWRLFGITFLEKFLVISQPSFCFCLTNNWMESKKNHHDKWNKNILICYKSEFWTKLAALNMKNSFNGDFLYADMFPMHYIDNFEVFIKDVCLTINDSEQTYKIMNEGTFLKHINFCEENEIRLKLLFHFENYRDVFSANALAQDIISSRITSKEAFINKCLEYSELVRSFYKQRLFNHPNIKNDIFFDLDLPQEIVLSDLIDSIKISNKILAVDKTLVLEFASQENIKVQMNEF